jgi:hypothetical protein
MIEEKVQITLRGDYFKNRNYKSRAFIVPIEDLTKNKFLLYNLDGQNFKVESLNILRCVPEFALKDVNIVVINRAVIENLLASNPNNNIVVKIKNKF